MKPVAATLAWPFRPGSPPKGAREPPRDILGSWPRSGRALGAFGARDATPKGPKTPQEMARRMPMTMLGCIVRQTMKINIVENVHAVEARSRAGRGLITALGWNIEYTAKMHVFETARRRGEKSILGG